MAERRMFAKTVVESDAFLEMPAKAQMLYIHLSMRADDEGFVNGPKQIMRMTGATEKELKTLIDRRFIIMFPSGVVVIKHWRINNYIRDDRRKETVYQDEMRQLSVKENGAYTHATETFYDRLASAFVTNQKDDNGQTNDRQVTDNCQADDGLSGNCQSTDGQVADKCQRSIGKDRLGKDSIGESARARTREEAPADEGKKAYGTYQNVLLTDAELKILKEQFPNADSLIDHFSEKLKAKGYKYASHYAAIISWEKKDRAEREKKGHRYDYDKMFENAVPDLSAVWEQTG